MKNAHDRNDRFSLLLHGDLVQTIKKDPSVLARGRRTIVRWQTAHGRSVPAWDEWLKLIDAGADAVVRAMLDESGEGTRLRQSSPFAGILPNRRRWELLKESHHEAR